MVVSRTCILVPEFICRIIVEDVDRPTLSLTELPVIVPLYVELEDADDARLLRGKQRKAPKELKPVHAMKCYRAEQLEAALKAAGFSKVTSDHHPSKPWITTVCRMMAWQ